MNEYLTNYWPISNSTMNDVIGNANTTQGNSTTFVRDRFGKPNSALSLNGGWTQVPPGIYFNSQQFTICAWIYPQELSNEARLLDFSNGPNLDKIVISLSFQNSKKTYFSVNYPQIPNERPLRDESITSSEQLNEKTWQFIVITLDGSRQASIYIDGNLRGISQFKEDFPMLKRDLNYIGKSSLNNDGYSSSYIDDLRFYNKSLTQSQIIQLMNMNNASLGNISTTEYFTSTSFSTPTSRVNIFSKQSNIIIRINFLGKIILQKSKSTEPF